MKQQHRTLSWGNAFWGATQRDSSPLKVQGNAALAAWGDTLLLRAAL